MGNHRERTDRDFWGATRAPPLQCLVFALFPTRLRDKIYTFPTSFISLNRTTAYVFSNQLNI